MFRPSEGREIALKELASLRRYFSQGQVNSAWVVTSSCTILESASSRMLDAFMDDRRHSSTSTTLEKHFIKSFKREAGKTWPARLEWLDKGFGVSLDSASKNELLAMVGLRNAIAHDGHSFTNRQIANYDQFLALRVSLEDKFFVNCSGVRFETTVATGDAAIKCAWNVANQLL